MKDIWCTLGLHRLHTYDPDYNKDIKRLIFIACCSAWWFSTCKKYWPKSDDHQNDDIAAPGVTEVVLRLSERLWILMSSIRRTNYEDNLDMEWEENMISNYYINEIFWPSQSILDSCWWVSSRLHIINFRRALLSSTINDIDWCNLVLTKI